MTELLLYVCYYYQRRSLILQKPPCEGQQKQHLHDGPALKTRRHREGAPRCAHVENKSNA